jgi:hypothetical protein
MGSAALMISSVITTGGFTALAVKKLGVKNGARMGISTNEAKGGNDASQTSRGEEHGSSENRVASGMGCGSEGTVEKGEGVFAAS